MPSKSLNLPISCTQESIFKKYLEIMNGVLSKEKQLTGIEIEVLEKMILVDYIYRSYPKDKRDKIIFNKITKDRIRGDVYNISVNSFNNILMKLRKKGLISKKSLLVYVPIEEGRINVNITLKIE